MKDDSSLRLILIILAATFLPIGLYHRIRSFTGEKLDRSQEGTVILFGLRGTALVAIVVSVAWMIDPASMSWSALALPVWLRWMGVVLSGCGGMLLVWTFHCLGKNLTDTVVTRKEHALVTTGPYRWVRHPFYAACAVGTLGFSLVTSNWFILLTGSIVFAFLVARTRIEERNLVERFGDDYRDFMKRVGRFWPRLWG